MTGSHRAGWAGGEAGGERRNGGELVMRALQREGVSHVFGLGGGHINPAWFAAASAGITIVDVRHEAAAAHAAEGWALATGEPGVCLITAGPGVTNALTGLANAYAAGSPVVCIAGAASLRGADTGEVEALEQLDLVRPVVKWARRIYHLDRIPEYVARAFREATTGRPGPVYLELDIDLIHSSIEASAVTFPEPMWREQRAVAAPDELIERAAALLRRARRPAIVAGSGVWWSGASLALQTFVEQTGIPVVTRQAGRGTVPDDHPLSFGPNWQELVYQADVLLVVGKQLDYFFGYGFFPHLDHLIQIDLHPGELGRNRAPVSVPILADAGAALGQLAARMTRLETGAWVSHLRDRADESERARRALAGADRIPLHPLQVCMELAAMLDRDATVVPDGSHTLIWTNAAFRAYAGGHLPSMSNLGVIGHGVAFALAAGLARPGSQIAWVVGDGSFGFNAMELDTAARFGLPLVTVVINNRGWSADWIPLGVRHYERLAGGFDGEGILVERPDQLRPAFEKALSASAPTIINAMVDPAPEYFPGRYLGR